MQRKLSHGGPHLSTMLRVKRTSSGSTPLGQTKRSPNRLRLGQPKGCGIQSGPALTQDPWSANNQDNTSFATNEFKKPKQLIGKRKYDWEKMVRCRQAIGIQNHMPCVNWNRTMLISISGWYNHKKYAFNMQNRRHGQNWFLQQFLVVLLTLTSKNVL